MAGEVKALPDTTLPLPPATAAVTRPTPAPSPTPAPGDITAIRTPEELRRIAEQSVGAEIAGEVNPLKGQVGTLQSQETSNLAGIRDMFGSILPFSAGAAERVGTAYDTAEAQQQSIFAQATLRMNQLRQSRAQEAQALAQEMGGPVSVGEFTSSMGFEPEALANLGAGQQLHTLQYGMADVGLANAFAGRVLPLVQTEETAKARQFYEDKITEIQKQIATLEGTKTSKVNAAANDLQIKEREFALQKTQQALDKLKADHDWAATQRTLKGEERRIALAERQFKLEEAGVTGTFKGKPTLAKQTLTANEKAQAAAAGMTNKEFQLRKTQQEGASRLAAQRFALTQRATWAQYLDMAINPAPGKTITETIKIPVDKPNVLDKDIYHEVVNGKDVYYKLKNVSRQGDAASPISDPTDLVDYLISHNVPKNVAVKMVRARLQIPNWQYGKPLPSGTPAQTGTESPTGK